MTVELNPEQQLATFIDKYDPAIATFARDALARMRERLPGAVEMVYDNYNALAIGFGRTDRTSEAVFSITLFPRWVSLFFMEGAQLEDPEHLLRGTGKQARHIVLQDPKMIAAPPVEALIAEALRRAGWAPSRTQSRELVIKSVSRRQRPRRRR